MSRHLSGAISSGAISRSRITSLRQILALLEATSSAISPPRPSTPSQPCAQGSHPRQPVAPLQTKLNDRRIFAAKKQALELQRLLFDWWLILAYFYFGQGAAECGSAASSGKLNAPSIAFEAGPCVNHCGSASVCGWRVNIFPFSLSGTATVASGNTSTGSPASRLPWQTLEPAGSPGNCQDRHRIVDEGVVVAPVCRCLPPDVRTAGSFHRSGRPSLQSHQARLH